MKNKKIKEKRKINNIYIIGIILISLVIIMGVVIAQSQEDLEQYVKIKWEEKY